MTCSVFWTSSFLEKKKRRKREEEGRKTLWQVLVSNFCLKPVPIVPHEGEKKGEKGGGKRRREKEAYGVAG